MIQQERIIEECVDELIELIDNSRTPAFGGEDRRVVETGAVNAFSCWGRVRFGSR